jgi:hypothetical protein
MWIGVIGRMVMSLGIAAAMFGGAAAQNTVKIGMVMPLTGTLASAGKQVPHRRAYAGLMLPRLLRFVRQPSPVQVLSPLNRLPTSTKLAAKPVRLVLAAQSAFEDGARVAAAREAAASTGAGCTVGFDGEDGVRVAAAREWAASALMARTSRAISRQVSNSV